MIDRWFYSTSHNDLYTATTTPLSTIVQAAKEGYGIVTLTYFTPSRKNKLEGLKEVVRTLFRENPALMRVTMMVPRNLGKVRALVKDAGFKWEGELRDGCVSRGKVCGLVIYGMTRVDFERVEGGETCSD